MKKIMSKVFGAFIAGSMVLSAMPTVVSAAEADIQPIDYETEYEDGTLIDFGEGARVCGYGEEENLQLVSGVLRIVSGEYTEIEDESDEEDEEGGVDLDGVLEVKFYNAEDVNVVNIHIYHLSDSVLDEGILFSTWVEGFRNVGDGDYIFDVSEFKYDVEIGEEDITDDDDTIVDDTTADDTNDVVDPVKAVIDMITALPEADKVTIDDAVKINDARREYALLSSDEKAQIGDALKQKLDDDEYALLKCYLAEFIGIADNLIEEYGDIMSDETKSALDKALADAKATAENKEATRDQVEGATDDLFIALQTADEELSKIYEITEGENSTWTKRSKDKLVFRFIQYGVDDNAYESFLAAGGKIYIDDVEVSSDNFTAEKGSVIISIIPELLETLSVGEHTLTIKFENSVSYSTKFVVKAASDVPATGETVSYVAIAGASLILLAGAAFVIRERMVREEK